MRWSKTRRISVTSTGSTGSFDISYQARSREMRGSGGGGFLAGPLWRDLVGAGIGFQMLDPRQSGVDSGTALDDSDLPYGKLSFGLGLSLERYMSGVSVGFGYSRLFSRENPYAYQVDQLDLGLTWRASRWLALGIVGHGLNQPRVGPFDPTAASDGLQSVPLMLEAEAALRPLGNSRLEVAVAARSDSRPWTDPVYSRFAPGRSIRGRINVRFDGLHLYTQAQTIHYNDEPLPPDPYLGVEVSAGIMLEFDHLGLAAGTILRDPGEIGPTQLSGGAARVRISKEKYANTLSPRPREVVRLPLASYGGERGLARLVRRIDGLIDRGSDVVLVETRGSGHSYAQTEEIREALLRFRARGGQVVAYLNGGGLRSYFLASTADRILAHPQRPLNMVGMSTRTFYFGDLLRKVGASAELIRVAEYKGTPEQFAGNTASPEVRQQRTLYQTDAWNHVIRVIERERGRNVATVGHWIDTAPHTPDQALALGIIDGTVFPDQLDADLEAWLDRPVRIELPHDDPTRADDFGRHPEIAVVYLRGPIDTGKSRDIPALGLHVVGSTTVVNQLQALRDDRFVKAVVIRLDTRGGQVSAGEAIARQLSLLAAEKPVVISMGTQTTSAGYLIAAAGDYIFANATTQTGSIGVYWFSLDITGVLERLGIGVDLQSYGQNATWRSNWKRQTASDQAIAQAWIQTQYDHFVDRVANARAMTPEAVDALARGRIWSGVRAIDNGLVDAYGGLREATIRARRMAGLRDDAGVVVEYPKAPSLLDQLQSIAALPSAIPGLGQATAGTGGALATNAGTPSAVHALAGLPFVSALQEVPLLYWILSGGGALGVSLDGYTLE